MFIPSILMVLSAIEGNPIAESIIVDINRIKIKYLISSLKVT
jgi:hypothetical protein